LKLKLNENKKKSKRDSLKSKTRSSNPLIIRSPLNRNPHQRVIILTVLHHRATAVILQVPEIAEKAKLAEEGILHLQKRVTLIHLNRYLSKLLKKMTVIIQRGSTIHFWQMIHKLQKRSLNHIKRNVSISMIQ